jgi:hypothetical protein
MARAMPSARPHRLRSFTRRAVDRQTTRPHARRLRVDEDEDEDEDG